MFRALSLVKLFAFGQQNYHEKRLEFFLEISCLHLRQKNPENLDSNYYNQTQMMGDIFRVYRYT